MVVLLRSVFTEMTLQLGFGFEIFVQWREIQVMKQSCDCFLSSYIKSCYLMNIIDGYISYCNVFDSFGHVNFVGGKYERSEETAAISLCSYV